MLKGSPCVGTLTCGFIVQLDALFYFVAKSLSQIRNITKLYAHLHRIIRVSEPSKMYE